MPVPQPYALTNARGIDASADRLDHTGSIAVRDDARISHLGSEAGARFHIRWIDTEVLTRTNTSPDPGAGIGGHNYLTTICYRIVVREVHDIRFSSVHHDIHKPQATTVTSHVVAIQQRAREKLRYLFFIVMTFVPLAALTYMAYQVAVTRYVTRHIRPSLDGGSSPGQIVSVFGTILAQPVRMPDDHPKFDKALMVVKLEERDRLRGGWKKIRRNVWTSDSATIGSLKLDAVLIEHAGFEWHRASPCTEYKPPPDWVAECPGARYAYRRDDDGYRMSYQATLIPTAAITMIAQATSGGSLTAIESGLSGVPEHLVIWADGQWEVDALLARELNLQLGWMVFWAIVVLFVVWRHMYKMLRLTRSEMRRGLVVGGLWRALIVVLPLIALAWPFDTIGFMATATACITGSAALGFGLWLRETMAGS